MEATFDKLFDTNMTLITKSNKGIARREKQRPIYT